MQNRKSKILTLASLIFGGGLVGCNTSESDFTQVNFQGTLLAIPSKYVLPDLSSVNMTEGFGDKEGGITLKIGLSEISRNGIANERVNGYVIALLMAESGSDRKLQISGDIKDAWEGIGLYSERIVEFDMKVDLYRVFPRSGYPKLWNYFRQEPSGSEFDQQNWFASCMVGPLDQEASDMSNVRCKTIFLYRNVRVELSFSGDQISKLGEMVEGFKENLAAWEENTE